MSIDIVLKEINAAGNQLILLRPSQQAATAIDYTVMLLRRAGGVCASDGSYLTNLRGVALQKDSDQAFFIPTFVGFEGAYVPSGYFGNRNGFSAPLRIGEEAIIAYLKETKDWDAGIGFGHNKRWEKALAAIDLSLDIALIK